MRGVAVRRTMTAGLAFLLAGCGALDVSDPTAIQEADVNNAVGADLLRRDALVKLYNAESESVIRSGVLTDELSGPYDGGMLDRRQSETYEERLSLQGGGVYTRWQEAHRAATLAIPVLAAHASSQAYTGEAFATRGYATIGLAETFCSGFPLHDIVDFKPVYGPPLTTDVVFERAVADFDSAIVYATDSARILNFARVGRARALLGLGRFVDAAAAVTDVPTSYVVNAEYGNNLQANQLGYEWYNGWLRSVTVANGEGGTGLDYLVAADPRIATRLIVPDYGPLIGTDVYHLTKYAGSDKPIVMADGIEARLIEAEGQLTAGGGWLATLNALRTDGTQDGTGAYNAGTGGVAGLAPLVDPGTSAARIDLLFRERAFWLFGTGHRLGDLRRLIARYDRSSESVFPTGAYASGGTYGTATSIPFPAELESPYNPAVTGCTAR